MAAGLAITQGCHDDDDAAAAAAAAPGPAPVALAGGMIAINPTLTFNGTGNSGTLTYDNAPDDMSLYTANFTGTWEYIRTSGQTGILKISGEGADDGKRLSGMVSELECNLLFIPVDAMNAQIASITVTILQPGMAPIVENATDPMGTLSVA
jgi:hypothetical protein